MSLDHQEATTAADADLLAAAVAALRDRVRALVATRSADDPDAHDPLRGLHHSAESIGRLLGRPVGVPVAEAALSGGPPVPRLDWLAHDFGLSAFDVDVLLVALAPDLDRVFEACYGYLNDDVTRRRATVGLAMELCGVSGLEIGARGRFAATAPLVAGGLLVIEDPDRPLLSRGLRVPDRVAAHLLGDDTPDDALARLISVTAPPDEPPPGPAGVPRRLVEALAAGPLLLHLRERRPGAAEASALAALHAAGRVAVRMDLTGPTLADAATLAPLAVREARLRGGGLVLNLVEPADPEPFCDPSVPVILVGQVTSGPSGTRRPLVVDIESGAGPAELWRAEAGAVDPGLDLAAVVAPYRLTTRGIQAAAGTARMLAAVDGVPVGAEHIHHGARLENTWTMGTGVRRVEPAVGWPELVLPDDAAARLHEFADRVRHRDRVLGDWRLRTGGGRGRGVTALFAGESGTGKTMAAEVIARELGLDLYVVELSAMVDKYVGETEKNLERLFAQADRVNAVLLFDEADAIFGKRSETKDAHDRYANMESSYLLQRLESFDGVAVLTTNLVANIDDAFTRRFDVVVDFPFPDEDLRRALWAGCLSGPVPVGDDVDLDRVAGPFELAGGSIRAAATTAAYLAAAAGRPVGMAELLAGARREYRKLGRLVDED